MFEIRLWNMCFKEVCEGENNARTEVKVSDKIWATEGYLAEHAAESVNGI